MPLLPPLLMSPPVTQIRPLMKEAPVTPCTGDGHVGQFHPAVAARVVDIVVGKHAVLVLAPPRHVSSRWPSPRAFIVLPSDTPFICDLFYMLITRRIPNHRTYR